MRRFVACRRRRNAIHISIHAPLAGCDVDHHELHVRVFRISIHAPLVGCDFFRFQLITNSVISIHAPLAGCDVSRLRVCHVCRNISIHAPLAGCDVKYLACIDHNGAISIHAPLAGCDSRTTSSRRPAAHFNPRTPCGVRPPTGQRRVLGNAFQSTHPLRGATPPRALSL